MKWRAEPINLNGHPRIRLQRGPFLEKDFSSIAEMAAYLELRGASLADVEIIGGEQ